MDKTIIDNWNSIITDNDTIYDLGDFAYKGQPSFYASRLKGKHILILGNHDKKSQCIGHFAEIHEQLELELSNGQKVLLHHHPYLDSIDHNYDNKFTSIMLKRKNNQWLLHGHQHNSKHAWRVKNRQINVGVDQWNYFPVSENQIIKLIEENT